MADKNVSSLPRATNLDRDSLLVVEQQGEAKSLDLGLLQDFAKEGVDQYVTDAKTASEEALKAADEATKAVGKIGTAVEDTQTAKTDAENAAQRAEDALANMGTAAEDAERSAQAAAQSETNAKASEESVAANKTAAENAQRAAETARDESVAASTATEQNATVAATAAQNAGNSATVAGNAAVDAEAARQAIENMMVEAVTVATGNPATVSKELVDGVVKLVFGLPQGAQGAKGDPGSSIQSIDRTSGNGAPGTTDTYTITLTTGETFDFYVYNGADGIGSGDMTKSVYDPQGKATDIFEYVDEKLADIDVDVTADEVTFADGDTFQDKYDSGELTGPPGKPGEDGEPGTPGYTPQKGVDYFDGEPGKDGVGIESVEQTTTSTEDGGENIVTVKKTDGSTSTFSVRNGGKGETGKQGSPGLDGADGSSIQSIDRTAGTGAAGTTDTYTITLTTGETFDFSVYNGKDGIGSGDMSKSVYDPQGKATDIFGYVDEAVENVKVATDATPTEGSTNPVQSGGVFNTLPFFVNVTVRDDIVISVDKTFAQIQSAIAGNRMVEVRLLWVGGNYAQHVILPLSFHLEDNAILFCSNGDSPSRSYIFVIHPDDTYHFEYVDLATMKQLDLKQPKDFIVTATIEQIGGVTAISATYEEIVAALAAGKNVIVRAETDSGTQEMRYMGKSDFGLRFVSVDGDYFGAWGLNVLEDGSVYGTRWLFATSSDFNLLYEELHNGFQKKLTGTSGQVVGFDKDGNAVAQGKTETWTFTLEDGSTTTKKVVIME